MATEHKSIAETLAPLKAWIEDDFHSQLHDESFELLGQNPVRMKELRAICALADQPPQLSDAQCDAIRSAILNADQLVTTSVGHALIRKAIESTK